MGIRPANACKGRADTPDRSAGQRDRTEESVADHTVLPCAGGDGAGKKYGNGSQWRRYRLYVKQFQTEVFTNHKTD